MHVADDLVGRFLEREEEGALPTPAGGLGKVGGDDGLAGAGRAREQNAAAAKKPRPPSIASSRGMPVAIRSFDTLCCSPSDVMGSTLMPSSPMRKGNSLVPCSAPRYFITRRFRVAI
jgi:hypothetical protein